MAIVVGIDGTGSAIVPGKRRDRKYDIDFTNSFVRRICRGGPHKEYFRGPVMLGGGLPEAIRGGLQFILAKRAAGVSDPIVLTGYSRGAAGVVELAAELKRRRMDVLALMMFDCVDRHLAFDAEVIPNNVGHVMHVVRDKKSSSREGFGNDGMRYSAPTEYPKAYSFNCTHGGMGGVPWKPEKGEKMTDYINEGGTDGRTNITFAQDEIVSTQVWNHVQPFLRKYKFI